MEIDLSKLGEPFPEDDIEWRVSRAGMGKHGIYCNVLAYITARAVQSRLDAVCGADRWRNEPPTWHELKPGRFSVCTGISILLADGWVTKWDVAETTNVEPAKGGFSGAMKRAGAQWGIGRYLYHLDEVFAEVSDSGGNGWNWAQLPEKAGGAPYYWKTPKLPAWALPKEPEHEVSAAALNKLKREWMQKFMPNCKSPADLQEGFCQFVRSVVGEFPISDHTCWTKNALVRCSRRIEETTDPEGIDSDVPV